MAVFGGLQISDNDCNAKSYWYTLNLVRSDMGRLIRTWILRWEANDGSTKNNRCATHSSRAATEPTGTAYQRETWHRATSESQAVTDVRTNRSGRSLRIHAGRRASLSASAGPSLS